MQTVETSAFSQVHVTHPVGADAELTVHDVRNAWHKSCVVFVDGAFKQVLSLHDEDVVSQKQTLFEESLTQAG